MSHWSMQRTIRRFLHYRPPTDVLINIATGRCPWPCRLHKISRRLASGSAYRKYSTTSSGHDSSHFTTTPIFYVNAVPHIGHLHTAVLADALARWFRICGENVVFSTGTDEHGLKIQKAAKANNITPIELCDKVSTEFKRLFDAANINYTDYIRTTEKRHVAAVQQFWRVLSDGGFIYRGEYEGWYSTSDEAFLTENDVIDSEDGSGRTSKVSRESGQPVEWMKEDNYMFRLSQFAPKLTDWLDTGAVQPSTFEPLVRGWIEEGLPDLSVSRQASRLQWGIPVPGDPSQTIYVWLDALVNYLTVAGYPGPMTSWPPQCQVIGKDILRFHAVYWPAFLMAAGMRPPEKVFCHSHWTVDGFKMSKSRGNVVDPFGCLDRFTPDGFRYFLLREGVPHSDGNYSERRVVECINSELVNTLGNLLSRTTAPAVNTHQVVPPVDLGLFSQRASGEERDMLDRLRILPDVVDGHYRDLCPYRGLEAITSHLHTTNAFLQNHKPWELVKADGQQAWLDTVLGVSLETLRVTGILLQPVVPDLAGRLLDRLGVGLGERTYDDTRHIPLERGRTTLGGTGTHLLKRIKL